MLFILFFLVASANAASDIPTLGVSSPVYAPALQNAEKALYAYTGANSAYHLLQDYTFGTSKSFLDNAGLAKEAGVLFFSYKVYRDRAVTIPMFDNTRITLHPMEIDVNIRF